MKPILAFILFCFSAVLQANMAYWGPEDGNVAGRNTSGKLRVLHETITADMREAIKGKIRVFADYRIQSNEGAGYITFLFVASSEHPVHPEVIMDGQVQKLNPDSALLSDLINRRYRSDLPGDSLSEIIGFELETDNYQRQHIFEQLYAFTLFITPGEHRLKVGYELQPTGFEVGDIYHWAFPYYLGNKFTRPLYDSIFVHVLIPEDMEYGSNIPLKMVGNELRSDNISGVKSGHIYIHIFKDVTTHITKGYNILRVLNVLLWLILLAVSILFIRTWLNKNKPLWIALSAVIPIGLFAAFAGYFSLMKYYDYFENLYGTYLRVSWGKGYYFIIIPAIMVFGGLIWITVVLLYRYFFYGKPHDPFRQRKRNS